MELTSYESRPTLYEVCIKCAARNAYFNLVPLSSIRFLPSNILLDIYYEVYSNGWYHILEKEFIELPVFERLLKRLGVKMKLHRMFQALIDSGCPISASLTSQFITNCSNVNSHEQILQLIRLGFQLGGFLTEAGWLEESESIISTCKTLCEKLNQDYMAYHLECYYRLLHVQNAFCLFKDAEVTYSNALTFVKDAQEKKVRLSSLAALFSEFSYYYFGRSEYTEAYNWSVRAVSELDDGLPVRVVVDVLSIATKACIVKRKFKDAELLVTQAVMRAKNELGEEHPKYADALLDYGLYLLNVDCVRQCVQVYQKALEVRQKVFNGENLPVAQANEDLAYAKYVCEYSSGEFDAAQMHAERAKYIMNTVVPKNHLLQASCHRIKALILEEIAIDSEDRELNERLLAEALRLHNTALNLCLDTFGQNNVQTAKHYGNLGRIYQSLQETKTAEEMHLLAISIKEKLLGRDDYEVALSLGHLASLYSYDMEEYGKAEELYHRSIAIGRTLFGEGYSGLEYDYRGLIHVYRMTRNVPKSAEYMRHLEKWQTIRRELSTKDETASPLEFSQESLRPVGFIRDKVLDGALLRIQA